MSILAKEAKDLSAISYTTPLQEVFHMNQTDNDKDLAYSNATTNLLQEVLMKVFLTMKKLFPTTWANEVFRKFLLIDIKSPDKLLCHILDGTLNPKPRANNFLSMNNTTLQVFARSTPCFNVPINTKDTKPWSIQKTIQ